MMETELSGELRMFRDAFRTFVEREIVPHYEDWEQARIVSRQVWQKAGEAGYLCMDVPQEYGGMGEADFRFSALVAEELARVGASGVAFSLHSDMVVPYITRHASQEQKQRWLPKLARGDWIAAVAMTEPNTGSDLAAVRSTAIPNGDHFLLNGQKTFISNGLLNDLLIVVAKTDPAAGAEGISLLVVESGMPGYERGRNLEKIGFHAQDTAELYFRDVRVPRANLIGEQGQGFSYLMQGLPRERLAMAVGGIASAEIALQQTVAYCTERQAFGRPISRFQHSRFLFAEMQTEVEIGRVFVDDCIHRYNAGTLSVDRAAMAKWWITEMQNRVLDHCLQLHGGYGYMREYPIARAFVDARAQRIYGGTTEIMKEIISRAMGL